MPVQARPFLTFDPLPKKSFALEAFSSTAACALPGSEVIASDTSDAFALTLSTTVVGSCEVMKVRKRDEASRDVRHQGSSRDIPAQARACSPPRQS